MALIADTVTRSDDASGDSFLTFLDGLGRQVQAVTIVNLSSDPMGVTGTPLVTSVSNDVTIDSTTPINVNIASESPTTPYVVYATGVSAVASAIISGSGYTLKQLRVLMDSGTTVDRWVLLFDADGVSAGQTVAELDSNNTPPDWRLYCPKAVETSETFDDNELVFTNGLVAALSSTPGSLTLAGSEVFFHAIGF